MAKILAESLLMKFTAQYTFFTFNFYIALQEMKVIHDIHALWNKSIIIFSFSQGHFKDKFHS